jgi:TPR repeat protein
MRPSRTWLSAWPYPACSAEAERLYRQAAQAGHTDAMFNLGVVLAERGGPDDQEEAERWYRQAAAADDTDAHLDPGPRAATAQQERRPPKER